MKLREVGVDLSAWLGILMGSLLWLQIRSQSYEGRPVTSDWRQQCGGHSTYLDKAPLGLNDFVDDDWKSCISSMIRWLGVGTNWQHAPLQWWRQRLMINQSIGHMRQGGMNANAVPQISKCVTVKFYCIWNILEPVAMLLWLLNIPSKLDQQLSWSETKIAFPKMK
jgi:hypothetical protein